ncbi:MAG: hypothetical protein WCC22_01145 [Terriglobales bacterium]
MKSGEIGYIFWESALAAETVAAKIGLPAEQVFKTPRSRRWR